jgi:hypothetical protein
MSRLAFVLTLGVAIACPAASAARLAPGMADVTRDARPLPFLSDDYARALSEARARDLPLFIEAWAPW